MKITICANSRAPTAAEKRIAELEAENCELRLGCADVLHTAERLDIAEKRITELEAEKSDLSYLAASYLTRAEKAEAENVVLKEKPLADRE